MRMEWWLTPGVGLILESSQCTGVCVGTLERMVPVSQKVVSR